MEFRELSVFEWEMIKPLLPPKARIGRLRTDDRIVLNSILYVRVAVDSSTVEARKERTGRM